MIILSEKRLKESIQVPCEGIFWFIDNELICLKDPINPRDPYFMTDLLHKESWRYLKSKYLVNGKEVAYDYFPRGRVEVLTILDHDGNLDRYDANIYIDRCINRQDIRDEVVQEYRLYLPKVEVHYSGQLFIDGSHYTCHNCR